MGHGWIRKVQGYHSGALPQGSRLPDRVRRHESQDVQQCQILAVVPARLGRAGHLYHASRQ